MEFSVKIEPDEDGYTGRECPQCEKYFKIKFGTGLPGVNDCHCPYCNHIGPHDKFWTKQQVEYAKSKVFHKISDDLLKSLKEMERKPDRKAFISIGITVSGKPTPIAYYSEKELEEKVSCNNCTLEYTIYGAFGYCPDCGVHNSLQIVNVNFDLALKILDLASKEDLGVKMKLIENSLEDAVSAFDGFGRNLCLGICPTITFQNIVAVRDSLLKEHGFDMSEGLDANQWNFVSEQFQKRHIIAHKMGVIDEGFILKTGRDRSLIGRKISITENDVRLLIGHLKVLAKNLFEWVARK